MTKFYTVHHGTPEAHMSAKEVAAALRELPAGTVIKDRVAQTIAAWWHSPAEPLTTGLSTRGWVDRFLAREHFATPEQYAGSEEFDRKAFDALIKYVEHWQAVSPTEYRFCACDDCLDQVVGKVGELCSDCTEAGCDNQGSACGREDVGQEDWHLACNKPFSECSCVPQGGECE